MDIRCAFVFLKVHIVCYLLPLMLLYHNDDDHAVAADDHDDRDDEYDTRWIIRCAQGSAISPFVSIM